MRALQGATNVANATGFISETGPVPKSTSAIHDYQRIASVSLSSSTPLPSSSTTETATLSTEAKTDTWKLSRNSPVWRGFFCSFFLVVLGFYCRIPAIEQQVDDYRASHDDIPLAGMRTARRLRKVPQQPPFDINKMGTDQFIFNRSVYGAIITSDYARLHGPDAPPPAADSLVILTVPTNATAAEIAHIRTHNALAVVAQLPFPVVHWPPVFTQPCPYGKSKSKTERGHFWAHLQIWMDFTFFDHDVILAVQRKEFKGMYHSTSWSSRAGSFSAAENGSLYKNGLPFLDDDILVIFEDDADIASPDINATLKAELPKMNTDVLYLGHCEERSGSSGSLCSHTYAVTRAGCRKLRQHMRPCGLAIDEQFAMMAKEKHITHRAVNFTSGSHDGEPPSGSSSTGSTAGGGTIPDKQNLKKGKVGLKKTGSLTSKWLAPGS